MDSWMDNIADFIRVRQLNIAVAILLSVLYVAYQYWGMLFKGENEEEFTACPRKSRSRSKSRSYSRSRSRSNDHRYKAPEPKHGRRGRKPYRRCPDCGQCNFGE